MHYTTNVHIGGNDVIARLNDSNRNADQPRFEDITEMLRSRWLGIWENLPMADQQRIADAHPTITSITDYERAWRTEQTRNFFNDMIQALSCRVVRPHMINNY